MAINKLKTCKQATLNSIVINYNPDSLVVEVDQNESYKLYKMADNSMHYKGKDYYYFSVSDTLVNDKKMDCLIVTKKHTFLWNWEACIKFINIVS